MRDCEWHPGQPDDDCPECLEIWEATRPDTVQEAWGIK